MGSKMYPVVQPDPGADACSRGVAGFAEHGRGEDVTVALQSGRAEAEPILVFTYVANRGGMSK